MFRLLGKVFRLGVSVLVVALLTGWKGCSIFYVVMLIDSAIIHAPPDDSLTENASSMLVLIPAAMLTSVF